MNRNKVALITGANKGLGFEIARQLGQQGVTVVLGARDDEKAKAAAARLKAEGVDAHGVKLDVTNESDVEALPAFFESKFGRLDILVNNAGVALDQAGVTRETFRQTYETNVIAPYFITQALLPLLKGSPAGRIVNQSSNMGSLTAMSDPKSFPPEMAVPAYCSSKAALNMLTVTAARTLEGPNVKVNSASWLGEDRYGHRACPDGGGRRRADRSGLGSPASRRAHRRVFPRGGSAPLVTSTIGNPIEADSRRAEEDGLQAVRTAGRTGGG